MHQARIRDFQPRLAYHRRRMTNAPLQRNYWNCHVREEWALFEGLPGMPWHVFVFSAQRGVFEELEFEDLEPARITLRDRGFSPRLAGRGTTETLPPRRRTATPVGPVIRHFLAHLVVDADSLSATPVAVGMRQAAIRQWRSEGVRFSDWLTKIIQRFPEHKDIVKIAEERMSRIANISASLDLLPLPPLCLIKALVPDWPIRNHKDGRHVIGFVDLSVKFTQVRELRLHPPLPTPELQGPSTLPVADRWLAMLQTFQPQTPSFEASAFGYNHVGWFHIWMPPLDTEKLVADMELFGRSFRAGTQNVVTIKPSPAHLEEELHSKGINLIELPG